MKNSTNKHVNHKPNMILGISAVVVAVILIFTVIGLKTYNKRPYDELDLRYEGVFEVENFEDLPVLDLGE